MAQLAPLNVTPARLPFGLLDNAKLRSLQSVKNRQNGLTNSAPSLKRRHASPENSDSENVDPNLLSTKRKRVAVDDEHTLSKPVRYNLNTVTSGNTGHDIVPTFTPRLDTFTKSIPTPVSAPAAAGRSPTQIKKAGLLGKRPRFAPPSFGVKPPPLSLAAALSGTLAQRKPKRIRTLEETKPKSWFFDIYKESTEHQDYRMSEWTMTQSATILDISDDESKAKEANDRGKENIDPNELSMPVTRSMAKAAAATTTAAPSISRKDKMTDEVRSPLSDLNPADYFAEGLDATSVVLVHDEPAADNAQTHSIAAETVLEPEHVADTPTEVPPPSATKVSGFSSNILTAAEMSSILLATDTAWDADTIVSPLEQHDQLSSPSLDLSAAGESANSEIEIWESESAKGDDDNSSVKDGDDGENDEGLWVRQTPRKGSVLAAFGGETCRRS